MDQNHSWRALLSRRAPQVKAVALSDEIASLSRKAESGQGSSDPTLAETAITPRAIL
jgi:hypothetical protein